MGAISMRGFIKVWFAERKWGLIQTSDGTEYFAHSKDMAPELKAIEKPVGMQVEFETIPGPHSGHWPKALHIEVRQ